MQPHLAAAWRPGQRGAAILRADPSTLPNPALIKTGRNDPCPCGSGRKYKLCHGALAVRVEPVPAAVTTAALPAGPARQCGPCTACCEGWAAGSIRGHPMHPGQPCHFLSPPAQRHPGANHPGGSPCSIYDERPESPCRRFVCGWRAAGSPFPETFRPDQAGVILVATRWRDNPAWILLPAGHDASPDMVAWMQQHAQATGQPFYYTQDGERLGYGPALFQHDMLSKLRRGEKLW